MIIEVIDRNGEPVLASRGKGIGIKQHDDVMLEYGYSKKTWLSKTIPVGQSLVIKITVPVGIQHHAESRILETKDSDLKVKILIDAVDGEFQSVVSQLPVVNNREDSPVNQLTIFEDCGTILTANVPSTGVLQADFPIWVSAGVPASVSPAHSASLKGRYSSSGLKALIITNLGADPTEIYYQYDYHEFEV